VNGIRQMPIRLKLNESISASGAREYGANVYQIKRQCKLHVNEHVNNVQRCQ